MCSINKIWTLPLFAAGLFIIQPLASSPEPPYKACIIKWAIQKTSTLRIQGRSNINSFGCDIIGYYQTDTISCSDDSSSNKIVALKGCLKIDVLNFDCHNKLITCDLRKTLKADKYPTLVIRFLSLERFPDLQNNKDYLKGWVEINLAGICKRFQINYSFIPSGSSTIRLNGSREFYFSDFKLTPPKKLAGLIKIKDNFSVDFQLVLNPVN